MGIQNKTAKGLLMSHFSQFISLKKHKVSSWAKLHTRLTFVCLFVRFFYQHGDFLTILPTGLFHYIIWDFSKHFHILLGVSFLNIL